MGEVGGSLLPRSHQGIRIHRPYYYRLNVSLLTQFSAKVCHQTHSIINRHLLPTSPSVGTDRTGLRVTIFKTTSAIFAFRFGWVATPWLIGDSHSPYTQRVATRGIIAIPRHPLTAIPTASME